MTPFELVAYLHGKSHETHWHALIVMMSEDRCNAPITESECKEWITLLTCG